MMRFVILLVLTLQSIVLAAQSDFNFDWKFAKGDHSSAIQPGFDDAAWQTVDLPHDWAISGPFGDVTEDGRMGKLPWKGEGYYRKSFNLPRQLNGKRLQFLFDGIMASPVVYLNGQKVGSWVYGYNSFHLDATDAAIWGAENVLTIHVDTRQHASRWYPGGGIYRKVTLRLVESVHIPFWGIGITTPSDKAYVINTDLANLKHAGQRSVFLKHRILDPSGKVCGEVSMPLDRSKNQTNFSYRGELASVQYWDIESPNLYTVETQLLLGRELVQTEYTTFGFRSFEFTKDDGFHLNGRRVQLNGVNLHHDHGPLGAAFFPRAMERQLQIMKDMGVNAIRTSHNAPAPELLELCDRMGLIVFNELFDKYGKTAGIHCNYDEFVNKHAEREVMNFVRRDRNHPSVVTWSIGNEIGGLQKWHVDKMDAYFKKYDPTRPTTIGSHIPNQAKNGILESLDTSGWNYAQKYLVSREANPDQPLIYSETASAFGTRGYYDHVLPNNKLDYGDNGQINGHILTAASWSDIPEVEFERIRKHSYLLGEFVWTGFDYLGEPTPFNGENSPMKVRASDNAVARSSYFGIVDLAGLPKDSYYLYRSHWLPDEPTVHLAPHWNWPGLEGKEVPVFVYTNGDAAELFLNGKSLGKRTKTDPDAPNTSGVKNLAYGKAATASSEEHRQDSTGNVIFENLAQKAVDGNPMTRWCASNDQTPQYLKVDLGQVTEFAYIRIVWEKNAASYRYKIEVSDDDRNWIDLDASAKISGQSIDLRFSPTSARYIRTTIIHIDNQAWASISEFGAYASKPPAHENPYFKIVDAYRLRWLKVPYEPGELKAVAYKKGQAIGEALVETTGAPVALRLQADRSELKSDGFDLSYIMIEAVDAKGRPHPLAMHDLEFDLSGPAVLAGVANGNPMGHDSFSDNTHPLFYGKAVAVIRTKREPGTIILRVSSAELGERSVTLQSN